MARRASEVMLILDGVVSAIKQHFSANPHEWFVIPKKVERGETNRAINNGPYPFVIVDVQSGDPTGDEQLSDGGIQENEDLNVAIRGLVVASGGGDAQKAAIELLTDLRRALMSNRQLAIGVDDPILVSGYIHFGSFTIGYEPLDVGVRGEVVLNITAKYWWRG